MRLFLVVLAAALVNCSRPASETAAREVRVALSRDSINWRRRWRRWSMDKWTRRLVGSAITTIELHNPNLTRLVDTRTVEGTREVFGSDSFPDIGLMATEGWLNANRDTARRVARAVTRAMQWMAGHSAEQIRAEMSEALRMPDAEADLRAIRDTQQLMSHDGRMPVGGPETSLKVVSASSEKVRNAHIDLSRIYTNEYVTLR